MVFNTCTAFVILVVQLIIAIASASQASIPEGDTNICSDAFYRFVLKTFQKYGSGVEMEKNEFLAHFINSLNTKT